VGDAEGVDVIPRDTVGEIAKEVTDMTVFEDFVLERVTNGESIFGSYPLTDESKRAEFVEWQKALGRCDQPPCHLLTFPK
jgi:hypothetical protein